MNPRIPIAYAIATSLALSVPLRTASKERLVGTKRVVSFLVVLACVFPIAAGAGAGTSLSVKSSLDGKTVLPHRIHWLAYPVPSSTKVRMEFLIDGALTWHEGSAPYSFADDGGYLVTSWLAPGKHTFTVRATARVGGAVAQDRVTASVVPPTDPPAALAGTWRRTPDVSARPEFPAGTYEIVFDKRWIEDRFPGKFDPNKTHENGAGSGGGLIQDTHWDPGPSQFHVQGSVVFRPFDRNKPEGGSWCENFGPGADYTWSVSGNTLTLAPVGGKDPCGPRGFIWTGDWTRVG